MATENKSELYPQPSALQENPPEPFPDGSGSGSSARDGLLEPAKQSSPEHSETQPTTNTSQERGRGSDSDPEPSRPPLFPEDDGDGNDAASEISIPSDHNDAAASQQGVIPPSASVPPPYWTNPRLLERQKQQQQNGKHLRPPHTTATTTASSSSLSSPSGHLLGNGHARTVSNASAESVLPPGAITLQDNEQEEEEEEEEEEAGVRGEGINGNGARANGHASTVGAVGTVPGGGGRRRSSDRHGRERNRACWARSVQVTDYVLVNGSTTNIGAFVVWIIKVETLNVRLPISLPRSFFSFLPLSVLLSGFSYD